MYTGQRTQKWNVCIARADGKNATEKVRAKDKRSNDKRLYAMPFFLSHTEYFLLTFFCSFSSLLFLFISSLILSLWFVQFRVDHVVVSVLCVRATFRNALLAVRCYCVRSFVASFSCTSLEIVCILCIIISFCCT